MSRALHFDLLLPSHHGLHSSHSATQAEHTYVATTRWEGINRSPRMWYAPAWRVVGLPVQIRFWQIC